MAKVVYLLGAGASAGANGFSPDFNTDGIRIPLAHNFHTSIQQYCLSDNRVFNGARDSELNTALKELNAFAGFIEKYNTIDEAMRKLYLKNETVLFERYKQLISFAFYILECMHKHKDTRYEQFLLTLVNSNYTLPNNINILSWNYDNQFELAASNIKDGETNLRSLVKNENYHKINGTAYDFDFSQKWHENSTINLNAHDGIISNYEVHKEYFQFLNKEKSLIEFAWEDSKDDFDSMEARLVKHLKYIKGEKEPIFLVVIGYSFPYVNSKYDAKIFDILNPNKVYIQDPLIESSAIEDLIERFGIREDRIKHIKHSQRFYLPVELYESKR